MDKKIIVMSLAYLEDSIDKYKLKRTVLAINAAYSDGETGLMVGQCKSLIESLCKSILEGNGIKIDADINISKLAKQAVQNLSATYPEWQEQKTKEAFIKLINSFSQTLDNAMSSIGTLRNEYCPLAHGRSANHTPLHLTYSEFVAQQTDAVLLFFLKLIEHKNSLMPLPISYIENSEFNEFLDGEYDCLEILGDIYQASDVLFQMNNQKYRLGLSEYKEGKMSD